jgi:3-deoxy-D-manno-octulosonate 8-phosphate phosphatase KdsC-like HAD superfamily phosphatase
MGQKYKLLLFDMDGVLSGYFYVDSEYHTFSFLYNDILHEFAF